MLGIENYGSDSDNDSEDVPESNPRTSKSLPAVKLAKKSTLTLNPSSSKLSAELALPPPKAKKGPKKITVGLPVLTRKDEPVDDDANERPAKKPRLQSGAGVSSLLSMLPAPKQKNPVLPTPVRVLGSGVGQPMSLETGRPNISVEESKSTPKMPLRLSAPSLDVFSLGSTPFSVPTHIAPPSSSAPAALPSSSQMPTLPTLSSAPKVEEFTPPEPTPTDIYPGYYLLPTGAWAAYEPAYYQSFYKKWESEYNAHVRALEKGMAKGFEGFESAEAKEVDAIEVMEKAKKEIQEREERKAVTHGAGGAPAAPRMNIQGAKLGGRARSRHQLSTLLNEAYENREALEERIAEGRRNRKEAGNKYGF